MKHHSSTSAPVRGLRAAGLLAVAGPALTGPTAVMVASAPLILLLVGGVLVRCSRQAGAC